MFKATHVGNGNIGGQYCCISEDSRIFLSCPKNWPGQLLFSIKKERVKKTERKSKEKRRKEEISPTSKTEP